MRCLLTIVVRAYLIMLYFFKTVSSSYNRIKKTTNLIRMWILNATLFLNMYYRLNNLLWQEGLLLDFVQKKTVDKLVRKFLILSAYLFSERLVFDRVVKFYSDFILWFSTQQSIYEFTSVAGMILVLLFTISILLLTLSLSVLVFIVFNTPMLL